MDSDPKGQSSSSSSDSKEPNSSSSCDPEEQNSYNSSDSHTPLLSSSENRVVLIGGHNVWEWAFLSLCIPNVILLLTSCGITLTKYVADPHLLNISCIFQVEVCIICSISLIFAIYGVFAEHQYDIYLHSILVFFAVVYSLASSFAENELVSQVLSSCAAFLWLVCALLGRKATTVPDWTEFRIIGASDPLTAMYKQVCYFLVVLKFDALFLVSVAICTTYILYEVKKRFILILGFLISYSIMSWTCGKAAVLKEDMYLSFGFIVVTIAYPAFALYQCWGLGHKLLDSGTNAEEKFYYTALVLELLVVVTKVHLVVQMRKTWHMFGYGLNTRSFHSLVTRDPSSLLGHSRSALLH